MSNKNKEKSDSSSSSSTSSSDSDVSRTTGSSKTSESSSKKNPVSPKVNEAPALPSRNTSENTPTDAKLTNPLKVSPPNSNPPQITKKPLDKVAPDIHTTPPAEKKASVSEPHPKNKDEHKNEHKKSAMKEKKKESSEESSDNSSNSSYSSTSSRTTSTSSSTISSDEDSEKSESENDSKKAPKISENNRRQSDLKNGPEKVYSAGPSSGGVFSARNMLAPEERFANEILRVTKENETLKVQIDHLKRKITQLSKENDSLKSIKESKYPQQEILTQILNRLGFVDQSLNNEIDVRRAADAELKSKLRLYSRSMVQSLEKDRKDRYKEWSDKLEKEIEDQKLSDLKQRYCFRCQQVFTESSNSPSACSIHTGTWRKLTKSYSCCGKKKGGTGCNVIGQHISNS